MSLHYLILAKKSPSSDIGSPGDVTWLVRKEKEPINCQLPQIWLDFIFWCYSASLSPGWTGYLGRGYVCFDPFSQVSTDGIPRQGVVVLLCSLLPSFHFRVLGMVGSEYRPDVYRPNGFLLFVGWDLVRWVRMPGGRVVRWCCVVFSSSVWSYS